ncbi:trichohyalin-like [Oryzias latipes]|uniref:trichohyalin-like n=1 Tax=Oryzias latipes TaxID=8090 RepID=UPI000CE271C6|nr:trichohyalin-like [Oryzias latipes]
MAYNNRNKKNFHGQKPRKNHHGVGYPRHYDHGYDNPYPVGFNPHVKQNFSDPDSLISELRKQIRLEEEEKHRQIQQKALEAETMQKKNEACRLENQLLQEKNNNLQKQNQEIRSQNEDLNQKHRAFSCNETSFNALKEKLQKMREEVQILRDQNQNVDLEEMQKVVTESQGVTEMVRDENSTLVLKVENLQKENNHLKTQLQAAPQHEVAPLTNTLPAEVEELRKTLEASQFVTQSFREGNIKMILEVQELRKAKEQLKENLQKASLQQNDFPEMIHQINQTDKERIELRDQLFEEIKTTELLKESLFYLEDHVDELKDKVTSLEGNTTERNQCLNLEDYDVIIEEEWIEEDEEMEENKEKEGNEEMVENEEMEVKEQKEENVEKNELVLEKTEEMLDEREAQFMTKMKELENCLQTLQQDVPKKPKKGKNQEKRKKKEKKNKERNERVIEETEETMKDTEAQIVTKIEELDKDLQNVQQKNTKKMKKKEKNKKKAEKDKEQKEKPVKRSSFLMFFRRLFGLKT